MKRLLLMALATIVAMSMSAAVKTDIIPGTLTLTADYSQQVLECETGSAWLVLLKDGGDGPQCKPGKGGVVAKTSIGKIRSVTVTWGSKSNEDIIVYGSHEPFTDPTSISGTELGIIALAKNSTSKLDIEGDWEHIGMTATNKAGKACAFKTIEVTWETAEVVEVDPQEGLVINEVCGNDGTADDGSEDWIELANATAKTISYEGIQVVKVDEDGTEEVLYTTPETAVIKELKAGEYLLIKRNIHFTSGISNSKNITIKLVSANGNVIDRFNKQRELGDNGHHLAGGSYSRIPDLTGDWAAVQNATPGAVNDATPIAAKYEHYWIVGSESQLEDGMKFVLVSYDESQIDDSYATNNEPLPAFVMSSSWSTTKDGGVYQLAERATVIRRDPVFTHIAEHVEFDANRAAMLILEDAGEGKWAIKFGETNNYLNEDRYLACTAFKSLDFKKSIDKKGVACTITFDALGVNISYGELAGSLKFNYKGDGTDRFLNYDPADKPEDHTAIRMYCYMDDLPVGIREVTSSKNQNSIYNLAGQKVSSDYNGIVIINGKKVVKK